MVFLQPGVTQAQQLTGIWRGHFRSNDDIERLSSGYDDRYKIEVQIAQTKNHFQAVTFSYKNTEFYGKALAAGTINTETKKVLLKESKIVEVRMAKGDVYIMTCFLRYSKLGDDEYLQGTYYSTNNRDSLIGGDKGTIFLHRVISSDFQKEPFLEKKEKELLALKKEGLPAPKPAEKTAAAPPVKKPVVTTPPVTVHSKPVPKTNLAAETKTSQKDNSQKNQLSLHRKQAGFYRIVREILFSLKFPYRFLLSWLREKMNF